ncbi:PREDICTED: uncharacterized protein At1g51745-like [Tarenaya hassleriana]|uniref:uncharacterized protein At1g51745-like n=1 Tax=Tarenaya hassleriana TaxID=28532 RepID=UPI00053C33D0|nr:PREDICTED: uncharacterized protein At1g51745-like [Tarenaya hassleriana]
MGSPRSGPADCTVGSIVWVRRRNGSWWPGKILGPKELDATHLTSPRSGTPVKLLGREDASVDWYNLEKSKRVKAFRCGDFDECIERVESAQGLPIRKREKYARREDAIIHALELEKEMLKKEGKFVTEKVRNKSPDAKKERLVVSGDQDICNRKQESIGCLRSNHVGDGLYSQKEKEENRPDCEDDHIEAATRMRGLQDLVLRTSSSKRKLPCSNGPITSSKSVASGNSPASSSGDHSVDRSNYALGKEHIGSKFQNKRPRYMFASAESNDALDLHNSLLSERKMMQSSFTGDGFHHLLSEEDPPEFLEDIGSDSSESDTDSSDTEEDTDDNIPMFSGTGQHSERIQSAFIRHMTAEDEITSSEDHDVSSFSGGSSYFYPPNHDFGNEAVSKWRLKGKRNVRNLPRRSTGKTGRFEHGTYRDLKKKAFDQKSLGYGLDFDGANDTSDGTEDTDPHEREFGIKMIGLSDEGCLPSKRTASRCRNIFNNDMLDWDSDPWEGRSGTKRDWEEKIEGVGLEFDASRQFGEKMHYRLIDVDVEVQGSYQRGPVSIISLVSKLDGRAIIGHPIEVEFLDGSSETYLQTVDYFGNETTHRDKPFILPPTWKTARRSSSRVPRLHPFSSLEVDDSLPDQGRKPLVKKSSLRNFGGDANTLRRSEMGIPRAPKERRQQQKKQIKKTSASSAIQKMRALSSFGSEQGYGVKPLCDKSGINSQMLDLSNRQVLAGPPTVACIPIKLVFSRLLEKINRPPSKPAAMKMGIPGSSERRRD